MVGVFPIEYRRVLDVAVFRLSCGFLMVTVSGSLNIQYAVLRCQVPQRYPFKTNLVFIKKQEAVYPAKNQSVCF